jgi:hypothetical protein
MEDKINIAEILRDMPKGTKLYSPLLGEVKFKEVVSDNTFPIKVLSKVPLSPFGSFTENGFYYDDIEDAEVMLLPSCEMRDWSKFFKHGDVVRNPHNEMIAVFDGWANDDYTEFNTTINYYKDHTFGEEEVCDTECFVKTNDEQKTLFIAAAEKHYGGKYNPETLQVEPVKVVEPKCSFKPFQEVLVRNSDADIWIAAHFSRYNNKNPYCYITTLSAYKQCVSYEGNQHLLGTDKSPE